MNVCCSENHLVTDVIQVTILTIYYKPGYSVRTRKYEARSFSYGPSLRGPCVKVRASYFQYGSSNLVSKSFIRCHHNVLNKNDFFARPTGHIVWYVVLMFTNLVSDVKVSENKTGLKFLSKF